MTDEDDVTAKQLEAIAAEIAESYTPEIIAEHNRQPVIISEDCRDPAYRKNSPDLSGQHGILIGLFDYEPEFRRLADLRQFTNSAQLWGQNPIKLPNPLIYVPTAHAYVWGAECYWASLEGASPKLLGAIANLEKIITAGKTIQDVDWDKVFKDT